MAKINHLEMGADVLALQDVQVKKGFMGLTVKLIYQPTNSVIKIKEKEYSVEDGRKLENILSAAPKDVETAISKFPVSTPGPVYTPPHPAHSPGVRPPAPCR